MSILILVGSAFAQFPVRGSFMNFERGLSDAEWALELDSMKTIGMNEVIVLSAGQFSGSDTGTTCSAADISSLWYSSPALGSGYPNKIGLLMSLAQARGMQVRVGTLQTSGASNSPHLRACNKLVAQEMNSLFGNTGALSGFYWTIEIWLNSTLWYAQYSSEIPALSGFVTDAAQVALGKTVMAAPYFKKDAIANTPGMTATQTGEALRQFIVGSGIKLVAPQDGIGAQAGAPPLTEIGSYYSAMSTVASANGATLWTTLETFVNNGGDQNHYPSATISRIVQQVNAEAPYVSGMISWMFGRDMSVQATYFPIAASQLYMDYQSTYNSSVPRWQKVPFSYLYLSSLGVLKSPSSAYPDPSLNKLNDGLGGGYGLDNSVWVGFSDADDGNLASVSIYPYGGWSYVTKIRVMVRSEKTSWIVFPQQTIAWANAWVGGVYQLVLLGIKYAPLPDSDGFSVGWVEMSVLDGSLFSFMPISSFYIDFHHIGWLFLGEIEVYQQ